MPDASGRFLQPIEPKIVGLDGKTRIIRYDVNALIELTDRLGPLDALFGQVNPRDPKALRLFLWAGLLHEDEDLTEVAAGKLVAGLTGLNDLVAAILEAARGNSLTAPSAEKPAGPSQSTGGNGG